MAKGTFSELPSSTPEIRPKVLSLEDEKQTEETLGVVIDLIAVYLWCISSTYVQKGRSLNQKSYFAEFDKLFGLMHSWMFYAKQLEATTTSRSI